MQETALGVGLVIIMIGVAAAVLARQRTRQQVYTDVAVGLQDPDKQYFSRNADMFYKLADIASSRGNQRAYLADVRHIRTLAHQFRAFEGVRQAWAAEEAARKAALQHPEAYERFERSVHELDTRIKDIRSKRVPQADTQA